MKKMMTLLTAAAMAVVATTGQVKPGIEVLADSGFEAIKGKRVGLITNPTGVDSSLKATADILAEAPGVEVTAFFAPEHGIRGDVLAGGNVANATDPKTGIPVYSVYGSTKKPTPEMLRNVDVLVYDIQDNGCRSYTFISTMGKAMEAAAEQGKEFVVLDRPNPLGGIRVEGLMTEPDCESFVSQFPIPYIYGLTAGELARYLKGEGLIAGADKLKLTVIPMQGWSRDMTFDRTGLPWVLPSPHIPSAETCIYYPASGIFGDLDMVSIGVGYTLPFRTFAAPWIDGMKLADALNALKLPGVRFRPISYTPFYSKFKGTQVNGVEPIVTDYEVAELTPIQFYVMQEIHRLYPSRKPLAPTEKNSRNLRMFDQVTGSKAVRRTLVDNDYNVEALLPIWNRDVDRFIQLSTPYLLY